MPDTRALAALLSARSGSASGLAGDIVGLFDLDVNDALPVPEFNMKRSVAAAFARDCFPDGGQIVVSYGKVGRQRTPTGAAIANAGRLAPDDIVAPQVHRLQQREDRVGRRIEAAAVQRTDAVSRPPVQR